MDFLKLTVTHPMHVCVCVCTIKSTLGTIYFTIPMHLLSLLHLHSNTMSWLIFMVTSITATVRHMLV